MKSLKSTLLFLLFVMSGLLAAQSSLFDKLHAEGEDIQFMMNTDWKQLMRNKKKKIYQPVTITVMGIGDPVQIRGKIRSRGNMRLEVCQNPSLKIKLKKADLRLAGFSDINDLKMVLQCSNSELGLGYLRREKLVYDLHRIVSPHTHRIVPLNLVINGGDTQAGEGKRNQTELITGFLIEDEEQLCARYEGRELKSKRASTAGLQREAYVNMTLFNYMILNTDWNVYNLHNVEFINPKGSLDIIPIPYDFDYCGLVGTSYAVPHESLDIESVQEPIYLGRDVTEEEIMKAGKVFREKKGELIALVENHPDLSKRHRKRFLNRFNAFYKIVENDKKLARLARSRK
ncbi:hypothetical protein [Lewinella sp. W8]|uniref:hypothetical protein n=1 Tax=Lewinella sp. W8 TaxID=2528208 RepID=UPI0010679215|nr:hypothetical protein [Lewinella sp. W8]MTB50275.1 hypothetical protein [Lewinella sp. W8]